MASAGWDAVDPSIGGLPLLDENGRTHPFSDLWKETTAVVVFLRHFG
ncbi:MAG: hypothetical protein AB7N65_11280 [Vicinamibacterales bacterium]